MRSASNHSESPFEQGAGYEPCSQRDDTRSNLDRFEALLAAAERASKAAPSHVSAPERSEQKATP